MAAAQEKPSPDFEICLPPDCPEEVPISQALKVINALVDLAQSKRAKEPVEINLLNVDRDSNSFQCVCSDKDLVVARLESLGKMLEGETPDKSMANAFGPVEAMARVARQLGGSLKLQAGDGSDKKDLATIGPEAAEKLRAEHGVSGRTVIMGEVMEIGGEESARCTLRQSGSQETITFDVPLNDAPALASHLYELVVLDGEASWLKPGMRLIDFELMRVVPFRRRSFREVRELLRDMGGNRWDGRQPGRGASDDSSIGEAVAG
ncbi:MAG: hypothetical protein R3336_05445 [Phycisphaeraceae bacterium]|nr:hypothetical protein [Phycisphaeraceae bacterium]